MRNRDRSVRNGENKRILRRFGTRRAKYRRVDKTGIRRKKEGRKEARKKERQKPGNIVEGFTA